MRGRVTGLEHPRPAPSLQPSFSEPSAPKPDLTHRRLEHLYEISQLLATPQDIAQTFAGVAEIIRRTLAIQTAILIDADGDSHEIISWSSQGHDRSGPMSSDVAHAKAAYARMVDGAPDLPRSGSERFLVLPILVPRQPLLGVVQLEFEFGPVLGKPDRSFMDAIISQLAVALERGRARRRDRRERVEAEQRRTSAEANGVTSERERRRAVQSCEEAREAVGVREQLLAVVSHDLKNPLGTILLSAEALLEGADVPETVGRIQRAANRMLRLIEDLLDFASIEAGRLSIRRDPHDPCSMIEETIASFQGARAKGVRLSTRVAPQLPMVFCDRDRILQVLSNLVGNAVSALGEGGQIVVRVEARAHDLLFAVSDDGPGIPAPDLVHLFERYWRSDRVDYKGTGLGLAISSGIVIAHGGEMWVESVLGHGATFCFTIPTVDLTPLFTSRPTAFPYELHP
jgi:signal transduction histidine kinase